MSGRTAARLGWAAFAAGILLFTLILYLESIAGETVGVGSDAVFIPVFVSFVGVGTIIVSRQPGNSVGWWMVAFVLLPLGDLPGAYARYAVTLPVVPGLAAWGAWLFQTAIAIIIVPFVLVLVLFPDGHLPSARWRVVVWLAAVATLFAMAGPALGVTTEFTNNFPELEHPVELLSRSAAEAISEIGFVLVTLTFVLAAASPFVRYRRTTGEERAQVRWVAYAAALAASAYAAIALLVPFGVEPVVVFIVFVPLIPIAIGIAILKYRLYDIDLVINKTVVYGALAVFISLVYAGVVVGIGALVGTRSSPVLSAAAAAIVALAFQPVRRRAQRAADRVVYGERATPYEVLSQFSDRLADSYAAEELLPRMARMLAEGTGAARADVWLRFRSELRSMATFPAEAPPADPVDIDAMPDGVWPVRHQGELLGGLSIEKKPGEAVTPVEEKLVGNLAAQAGLVLRNAALIADLRASRERLVTAQDEERRKLERNLHDGAQQQLVALSVKAKLGERLADRDPTGTKAIFAELRSDASGALENLRDLARGIYPPLLADQGLAAALETQARKSPVPVTVDAAGIARYPRELEAGVYFCVLEALQNVAKYAHAKHTSVRLTNGGGELRFEVRDDGRGFDSSAVSYGTGLQGIVDRLEAVGGQLSIESTPGRGTTVTGRLPT